MSEKDFYSKEKQYGDGVPKNVEQAHNISKPIAEGMKLSPKFERMDSKEEGTFKSFTPRA